MKEALQYPLVKGGVAYGLHYLATNYVAQFAQSFFGTEVPKMAAFFNLPQSMNSLIDLKSFIAVTCIWDALHKDRVNYKPSIPTPILEAAIKGNVCWYSGVATYCLTKYILEQIIPIKPYTNIIMACSALSGLFVANNVDNAISR